MFEHIDETKTWDAVMGFSSVAALLLLRVRPIMNSSPSISCDFMASSPYSFAVVKTMC